MKAAIQRTGQGNPKGAFQALVMLLGITAASDSGAYRSPADVVPVPDTRGIPQEVLGRWVNARCIYPGNRPVFEACVRTIASRLPAFDPSRPHHFGEKYSPNEYVKCRLRNVNNEMLCEYLTLVRHESPIYWPNPKVPMPKLPEAPKESVYRWWMTNEQYFEALCKAEAGEFINKKIEGVDGVLQLRPRPMEIGDVRQEDRFVIEDPYNYREWEAREPYGIFVSTSQYEFFETWNRNTEGEALAKSVISRYRLRDGDKNNSGWRVEKANVPLSRFGYLWRGIVRTKDRERNIAGGEIIVIDLDTAEVLGLKRGFKLGGPIRKSHTEIYWEQGKLCPGDSSDLFRTATFVQRVLIPKRRTVR